MQIYIETSVWSFAFADDSPDYTAETLAFFDRCRQGLLTPVISTVVLEELDRADDPLRTQLRGLVDDISPTVLRLSADARSLADAFLRHGAVPPSKPEDARHVAVAFVAGLDVLVSWNFRHIANVRRADRFNAIALLEGFHKPLHIVSPAETPYDDQSGTP